MCRRLFLIQKEKFVPTLDITLQKFDNICMLTGQLSPSTSQGSDYSNTNNVWRDVFEWLRNLPQNNPDGEQLIREHDIYANFMTAKTQPRESVFMEAHKNYIDLHFCISGGELIEWAPAEKLEIQKEYDQKTDAALYILPSATESLIMTPGKFAVFFPGEAHMPKISDGINETVQKVVVKIKADLII